MVLIDSETVSFRSALGGSIETVYDIYRRIQVFNKEGFDYATVKIPYFSRSNAQMFEHLDAQTISKDESGKIQITKLKDNAFFDENETDYVARKKFAFANVAEGSILEYRYTLVSKYVGNIRDWAFQGDIPTVRSSVTIKVPEYYHYTPTPQGGVLLNAYKTEPYNEWLGRANVTGLISYYMMSNIPAFKKEAYLTTPNDYLARIIFPLSSVTYPNQKASVADTWDLVVQKLMSYEYFGTHLNEVIGDQIGAAKEVATGFNTKEAKAKALYAHIMSKIKWNGSVSLYATKRLSKTYTDGNGNSAEINMLLLSMLRAVGIKADPVLISTRQHGMVLRAYPRFEQFNNVIVCAELDSGLILLDAAAAFKPYELLGNRNLNGYGLRIVKSADESQGSYKGVWVDIEPSKNSSSTIMSMVDIDTTGNQKSKTTLTSSDYPAINLREELEKDSVKECLKKHLVIKDEFDIVNEHVDNVKDLDKKLKFSFSLEKKDGPTETNILYVNPFPVKFINENPFKLKKRTYPVDFNFPLQENLVTTITVPANYKVTELPKSIKIKLEDGSASFSFLIGQNDNIIQVNSSLKINKSQFQPGEYDDLKAFYEKIITVYNSTIVFEKSK